MKYALLAAVFLAHGLAQVVITDTGSTNRPGMTLTMQGKRKAEVLDRSGTKVTLAVRADLQKRLMKDLSSVGPLDQMQVRHCVKSVSFGSSMFVSYNGTRSPDLSCQGQTDPAAIALQKDAMELLEMAKAKMPAAGMQLK